MRRPILTVLLICACVAESSDTTRGAPARRAVAAQDTTPAFRGTLGPVRRAPLPPRARPAVLGAVRAGEEAGFDRVVFEFSSDSLPGYQIQYVTQPVRACGSGSVVPLAGEGRLVVRFEPAQAHDSLGHATLPVRALTPRLAQILELQLVCDFEGQVEWAVGLTATRHFRVLEQQHPARLILDVRQRD